MSHEVHPHDTKPGHFYVNGLLIAGAVDEEDAIRIYEELRDITGP